MESFDPSAQISKRSLPRKNSEMSRPFDAMDSTDFGSPARQAESQVRHLVFIVALRQNVPSNVDQAGKFYGFSISFTILSCIGVVLRLYTR